MKRTGRIVNELRRFPACIVPPRKSPEPQLGIETKTDRFHPMAIAALSTENLAAASEHMARYKKLTAPEEILAELDLEEFAVGFRWLFAVDAEPFPLTDYCFS